MLYMLLSRFAEDEYVINEDKNKVGHSRQGIDATVSKVLGLLKDPVHDCLEGGWRMGELKGQNPKLVVPKRSPKGSLRSVRFCSSI